MVSENLANIENVKKYKFKKKDKKVKRWIKISIILIIISNLIGFLYIFGFIPLGLNTYNPPVGNVGTMDVDKYLNDLPELADIPNLEKIQYQGFRSQASTEEIAKGYDKSLKSQGYNKEYCGTIEFDAITYEVAGYLKGITAVGVIATSETYGEYEGETVVLYVTGIATDFLDMVNYFQNN